MDWATQYQAEQAAKESILDLYLDDITGGGVRAQGAIFVPRHELAREVKEVIERNLDALGKSISVPILRGRYHEAEKGGTPCQRWQEACELGRKGLPVYSNLCRRTHEGEISECPHFANCEYIRSWREAYFSPFVILVHSHLGLGWESADLLRRGGSFSLDDEHKRLPPSERSFNPANAAIVVCDEDPTLSLIESTRLERGALQAITGENLGELISEGLAAPNGLLTYLREKGISPEQIRATAQKLEHEEWKRGQFTTSPSASDTALTEEAAKADPLIRFSRTGPARR